MKVIADRVHMEEIMKAHHQGMGSLLESRVIAGHFDQDQMGVIVELRLHFPHIFKVREILKYCDVCQCINTTNLQKG